MPITRVKCSAGYPYSGRYKEFSIEDCAACANSGSNKCHFNAPMIRAVHAGWKDSANRNPYSASSLVGCPRRVVLKHNLEYGADPVLEHRAMRGTLFHSMLEQHAEPWQDEIVETRFSTEFEGVKISGMPDLVVRRLKTLYDYKTTDNLPLYKHPYVHHKLQTNIYKWILSRNGIEIDKIIIQYISMSDSKQCEAIVMSDEEIESFIRSRLNLLRPAFEIEDEFESWVDYLPAILGWDDPQCKWCELKNECYALWEQEIRNGKKD